MNIWEELPKPFFVLAPMDDVTDTVFRQIVAGLAPPDLYFTEFVNVDGLQSPGRKNLLHKLAIAKTDRPIIAQLWGKSPENYYKTTQELKNMGFAGIDINMGCPVKTVVKNGCCVALVNDRERAQEIIQATQEGAKGLAVSVKTRLGFDKVDMSWPEFLLGHKLEALTIHGRTAKQMSDVPADWAKIGEITKLRDKISPQTKVIGNGDVMTCMQGSTLYKKYGVDGIMIGRGIFNDPFVFSAVSTDSPWKKYTKQQKIDLYKKHIELFQTTWTRGERKLHTLNKFCKIYINGFDGAKELREKLMAANTADELLETLNNQ